MEICEGHLNGFLGLMNLMLCKITHVAVSLMQYSHFHIFLTVNFWNRPFENVTMKTILHSKSLAFSPNYSFNKLFVKIGTASLRSTEINVLP